MKPLPGNPFATASLFDPEKGEADWAIAQTTMALAFEQRTANLISLLPQIPQTEGRAELVTEITDRLTLDIEVQS